MKVNKPATNTSQIYYKGYTINRTNTTYKIKGRSEVYSTLELAKQACDVRFKRQQFDGDNINAFHVK